MAKKHLKNVLVLSSSLILGAVVMCIGAWQLDYIAGPAVWNHYKPTDLFAFPVWRWDAITVKVYDAYTRMFAVIALGALTIFLGTFLSLWFWEE